MFDACMASAPPKVICDSRPQCQPAQTSSQALRTWLWPFRDAFLIEKRPPRQDILIFKNQGEAAGSLANSALAGIAMPMYPFTLTEEATKARTDYYHVQRALCVCEVHSQDKGEGQRVVAENGRTSARSLLRAALSAAKPGSCQNSTELGSKNSFPLNVREFGTGR